MKKSRVVFMTLLTSLGLAGAVEVQNNHFIGKQFGIGIVAKADGIPSPITNINGDSKLLFTPYTDPNSDHLIQRAMFISSNGANSVNSRPVVGTPKGDGAVTSVFRGIKDLTLNIPIINTSEKPIYFREFFELPNESDGSPIFKIGTGDDSTDRYILDPNDLGLTDGNWIPEKISSDGKPTDNGLRYRGPNNGDYDYPVTKDSLISQREVSGIGFYGTIKAGQKIDIKIPIYLSNAKTVTAGKVSGFYDIFYNYATGPDYNEDTGNKDGYAQGTYLWAKVFDKYIDATNATAYTGITPQPSMFDIKDPNPSDVKVTKVVDAAGNDVTGKILNVAGKYKVTLSATNYGDTTVYLTVNDGGSTGGGTGTTTVPATPLTPATNVPTSSSSSTTSSSSSTPTTTTKPSTSVGPNIAVKGEAVYATKKIALYKSTSFTKSKRIAWYPKQKRVNRPMFVVTGYKRTSNGTLRYKVRDVNHGRKTAGKKGYITASRKYVVPVYYASVPKSKKIMVISPKGVNAYKSTNLTGKAKHYKKGVRLTVKKLVKHNLTTRYQLSNGNYITANKKLIIAGNY